MKLRNLAILAMAATGVYATGCASQQRRTTTPTDTTTRQTPMTERPEQLPDRNQGMTTQASPRVERTMGGQGCVSMAYPTGDRSTSVVLLERCLPREVRMNEEFTYEMTVTNLTRRDLSNVTVTEEAGNCMQLVRATPTWQSSGGNPTWSIGDLGAGESRTISVVARATCEGMAGVCASVSYNNLLCGTVPVVSPELQLVKTGPTNVSACDEIVYRLTVKNTGTGTVRGVKIMDNLPQGVMSSDNRQNVEIPVGDLAAGQERSFNLRAKASGSGRYTNRATASGSGVTAESGTVTTAVTKPKLTISKECVEREFIGVAMQSRITVRNTGDGPANNVVLTDTWSGARGTSASDGGSMSGNTITWNLGTIAAGASKTVTCRAVADAAGTASNTATARAACADPVSDSCSTRVTGIPAILLEVVDDPDPVRVGTETTYTITVTNQGSAPDTNIRIIAELENEEHVSNSGPTSGTVRGNRVEFAPIASLAPKAQATYRVRVRAVEAGNIRFKVTMTSDESGNRPIEETESTNLYN